MATKPILIAAGILLAAFLGYVAGSKTGSERASQRAGAEFRISVGVSHYQMLKDGEVERVKNRIGFLLWSELQDYERRYGVPAGTDRFARNYATAKVVADRHKPMPTDLGSVLATSLPPDIKLEIK